MRFPKQKILKRFLLSGNIGEILTVFMGVMFGWTLPLTATQLLWVNLVTDSLPAIALGFDPPEDDIMKQPPRDPKKSIFADGMWLSVIFEGLMIGALALLAFSIGANLFASLTVGTLIYRCTNGQSPPMVKLLTKNHNISQNQGYSALTGVK